MAGSIPGGGLRFPGGAGPSASGRSPFGPPHRMVPSSLSPLKNPQGPPLLILSLSTKKKRSPLPFQVFFFFWPHWEGGSHWSIVGVVNGIPCSQCDKSKTISILLSPQIFVFDVPPLCYCSWEKEEEHKEATPETSSYRKFRFLPSSPFTPNATGAPSLLRSINKPEMIPFFFQSMEWMETSLFSRPRCFYRPSGGWLINALIYRFHHGRWFVSPSR